MFRVFDSVAAAGESLFLLIGRLGIAALYVPSGWGKLTNLEGFAGSPTIKGLPIPMAWAVVIGLLEFVGGLSVVIGLKMRPFALVLAVFTVMAALLAHNFWVMTDPTAARINSIMFYKNLAIAGGLLIL